MLEKSKEYSFVSKRHQFLASTRNSGLRVRRFGSRPGSISNSKDLIFPTLPGSCEEGMDTGIRQNGFPGPGLVLHICRNISYSLWASGFTLCDYCTMLLCINRPAQVYILASGTWEHFNYYRSLSFQQQKNLLCRDVIVVGLVEINPTLPYLIMQFSLRPRPLFKTRTRMCWRPQGLE